MYQHCIYCAADLARNRVLEAFPVGTTVAYDPARGRMWSVCAGCGRWNLAPIDQRWEAVEQAERLFADSRLKVHRENVGLVRMPDGTRLVRVGTAQGREFAAWRYGAELTQRRRKYVTGAIGVAAGAAAIWAVGNALAIGGVIAVYAAWDLRRSLRDRRVIHWAAADATPAGTPFRLTRGELGGARLSYFEGEPAVVLPQAPGATETDPLVLRGTHARSLLGRAMVVVNRAGADQPSVDRAVAVLGERGPEAYLAGAAERGRALGLARGVPGNPLFSFTRALWVEAVDGVRSGMAAAFEGRNLDARSPATSMLSPPEGSLESSEALALEMALHEEQERRAMEGELDGLIAAWREAETIAAIADGLAGGGPLLSAGATS